MRNIFADCSNPTPSIHELFLRLFASPVRCLSVVWLVLFFSAMSFDDLTGQGSTFSFTTPCLFLLRSCWSIRDNDMMMLLCSCIAQNIAISPRDCSMVGSLWVALILYRKLKHEGIHWLVRHLDTMKTVDHIRIFFHYATKLTFCTALFERRTVCNKMMRLIEGAVFRILRLVIHWG